MSAAASRAVPDTSPASAVPRNSGFGTNDSWRDESWFAALGLPPAQPTQPMSLDGSGPADAAGRARPPATPPAAPPTAWRVYRAFALARAVLGVAMVAAQLLLSTSAPVHASTAGLALCVAYAAMALLAARPLRPDRRVISPRGVLTRRWFALTVGLDLAAFSGLMLLIGPGLNVAALLALPVLMAAALSRQRIALAVAAAAALALLTGATLQAAAGDWTGPFMQAGLAGAGLFAMALLTGELTTRLAREEHTARSSLALARQQALLNRLVIEEMQDGVLVADRNGQVRAANPAALALIGASDLPRTGLFSLHDQTAWLPLVRAIERAYAAGAWPEGGRDLTLRLADANLPGGPLEERSLRLRMRFARRREREIGEALCVLFLEDVRTLRARARQEKLAAMGRVSAGIAHEIRNPLAAIAQASELMAEDLVDPAQRRLATIVADIVERLRRIVDDVMAAAPGGAAEVAGPIDLGLQAGAFCAEWLRTTRLPEGSTSPIQAALTPELLPVRFDTDHLRRVLVNLLDNAWRHSSQTAGAVAIAVQPLPPGRALLSVASDGETIGPDVERHLFEPFFSTRSRGSGLGLYICRELCQRYGASIDYRAGGPGARHTNVFVVTLPVLAALQPLPADPLPR
ncbi:MAG: ATP-binding protein [Burkholderiales bacterium]